MAAAKKDKHGVELAKFVKAWTALGAPTGSGSEQALRLLLARNGTREGADKACEALWERFVDINEFRIAGTPEIGAIIGPFVKNDPEDVAHHLRGFLREYYKHRNTLDFGEWRERTPDQMRKYLDGNEWFTSEIGAAIFLDLLAEEMAEQDAAEPVEAEPKTKKRTEREAGLALDRLRMACAFAAFGGTAPSKAKLSTAHRKLPEVFQFGPVPPLPPPPAPPTIPQIVVPPAGGSKVALKVVKTPAKAPAAPAADKKVAPKAARKVAPQKTATEQATTEKVDPKKTATRKTTTKKTDGKTSASRAGGGASPRTTRAVRSPSKSKKSSRR